MEETLLHGAIDHRGMPPFGLRDLVAVHVLQEHHDPSLLDGRQLADRFIQPFRLHAEGVRDAYKRRQTTL